MTQPDKEQTLLLNAARNGDDDALGELIENFRPMLRAEAMRHVDGRSGKSRCVGRGSIDVVVGFPSVSKV